MTKTIKKLSLSPSALSTFVTCPSRFAREYLTGSYEEPVSDPTAPSRNAVGTEMHRLLELGETDSVYAGLGQIAKEYFEYYKDSGESIIEKEQRLEANIPGTPFFLNGKYDRISMIDDRLTVIDVKTHKSSTQGYKETKAVDFQLTSYAYLVWRNRPELIQGDCINIMYDLVNVREYKTPKPARELFERVWSFRTIPQLEAFEEELKSLFNLVRFAIENDYYPQYSFRSSCFAYFKPCAFIQECEFHVAPKIQPEICGERVQVEFQGDSYELTD